MQRMMDYIILKSDSSYDLGKKVNDWIKLGYKPCGNMSHSKVNADPGYWGTNTIEEEYCQPMMKE